MSLIITVRNEVSFFIFVLQERNLNSAISPLDFYCSLDSVCPYLYVPLDLKTEQAAQTKGCIQLQLLKGSSKSCQRGLACLPALWVTPFKYHFPYFKCCWMTF